jgi:hypothetical protein
MASESQNVGKPTTKAEAKSAPTVLVVDLHDPESILHGGGAGIKTLGDIARGNTLAVVKPSTQLKDSESLTQSIVASIRAHVKEHGTVPELRLNGHGSPNRLYFGKNGIALKTGEFITTLLALQEEIGVKVADKITFMGCNTFTKMSPEWVDFYRQASTKLGTEIVGTTNIMSKGKITGLESLPYISFKNGEVGHFTLDISPMMVTSHLISWPLMKAYDMFIAGRAPIRDNWTDCHLGRTQEDGATCQKSREKLEVANAKVDEWLTAPARFVRGKIKELNDPKSDKGQTR